MNEPQNKSTNNGHTGLDGLLAPGRATGLRRAAGLWALLVLVAAVWAQPLSAANFIWKVTSKNGGESYIMGSLHLATEGLYPLREPIMSAFARANALAVEVDSDSLPPEAMTNYIMAHGISRDKRPLLERLTPATRAILEKSDYYNPSLSPMAPWLVALAIQMEAMEKFGFKTEYGLDHYFSGLARQRGLKIVSLETLEDQLNLLSEMNEAEADLFLRSTLLELDDLPKTMGTFLDTWNEGDVAGFAAAFFDEYDKYPELLPVLDKLIFLRNKKMAETIDRLLRQSNKVHFIIVGAGHLVGEKSILAHLAAKGYQFQQL